MKRYEIIQTISLGYVEVPDDIDDTDGVLEYMSANDLWPDRDEEVVLDTKVYSAVSGMEA